MSLYVRHSAWLNTAVERPKDDRSALPRVSRLQKLRKDNDDESFQPEMPPIDAGYLVTYLWEVGPCMAAGMGMGPITHEELRAWQENTGIELKSWEARVLKRLSGDYLSESQKAEKPNCPAPWLPGDRKEELMTVAKSMRESIRLLAKM